jgi:hypothetical protein
MLFPQTEWIEPARYKRWQARRGGVLGCQTLKGFDEIARPRMPNRRKRPSAYSLL